MKRQDIKSIFVYILMLIIVFLVAIFVIQKNFSYVYNNLGQSGAILCVVLSLLIGLVLNSILIELGHITGAKLGGYKIYNVTILGLCFYKKHEEDKHFKFKFSNFDGLTGETKIYQNKEKTSPRLYILLPILIIFIEVIVLLSIICSIKDSSSIAYIKYASIIVLTIGGIIILYDFIPLELDSSNDGYRYVITSKKENLEAYNEELRILKNIEYGKLDYDYKMFDEITDYTAKINSYSFYHLILEDKVDDVLNIVNKTLDSKISDFTKEYYSLTKFYLLCLKNENVKEYYESLDSQIKKDINLSKELLTARCYLGYLLCIDNSSSELNFIKSKISSLHKKSYELFKDDELKLFNKLLEKEPLLINSNDKKEEKIEDNKEINNK